MKNNRLKPLVFLAFLASSAIAGETEKDVSWLKEFGGDFRYRIIKEDARKLNSSEVTNDRLWQRFRLRLWATVQVIPSVDINVRMVTEPRYYNDRPTDQWVRNELLFDRLNIVIRDTFGFPVTVTLGRQQIRLANGWLVGEGTPLDGTRTDYFDALRLTWAPPEGRTSVDLMYIDNRRDSSTFIPPFDDQDFDVIEEDQRGVVLYVGNEIMDRQFLDGYFIYKKDHNPGPLPYASTGETYTFGLRGHGNLTDELSLNAEIAPQFGDRNGKSFNAFAANTWIQWDFDAKMEPSIRLGYEYASGDEDPDKAFDKLWARKALWSDLYTGGVDGFDGRPLDSSNLHRPHAVLRLKPAEKIKIFAEYSILFADTYVDLPTANRVDDGSKFRGHHIKAAIVHQITDYLKHYVTAQVLVPGDYYSDDRQDTATWFRYAIELKW